MCLPISQPFNSFTLCNMWCLAGVLYIIPFITQLLAKNYKIISHCVFLQFIGYHSSAKVIDVSWQPNTLGLISYSTTCGVIGKTWIRGKKIHFPWQQSIMLINGQLYKNNWPSQVNGAFYSIKKSRLITYYSHVPTRTFSVPGFFF